MDATTTASIRSLLRLLVRDYPAISFIEEDNYKWQPETKTVSFSLHPPSIGRLLHELGHALLDHRTYLRDIDLLKMERDAWQKARERADFYGVRVSESIVDEHLDSYRDWLHARSTCPHCQTNGLQTSLRNYRCIECGTAWTVNEAKQCQLRRRVNS